MMPTNSSPHVGGQPGPGRPPLRALLTLALATVFALLPTAPAAASHMSHLAAPPSSPAVAPPAPANPAPAPTAPQRPDIMVPSHQDNGLAVRITRISPAVLTGEGSISVSGTILNSSSETVQDPYVELTQPWATPSTSADLISQLAGEEWGTHTVWSATVTMTLAPGASGRFSISVPTSSLGLTDTDMWGARVIGVHVDAWGAAGVDRTVLVWDPQGRTGSTSMGVLVPWTAANDPLKSPDTASSGALPYASTGAGLMEVMRIPGVSLAVEPGLLMGPQSGDSSEGEADAPLPEGLTTGEGSAFWRTLLSADELVALPAKDADVGLAVATSSTLLPQMVLATRSEVAPALRRISSALDAAQSTQGAQSGAVEGAQSHTTTGPAPVDDAHSASGNAGASGVPGATVPKVVEGVVWPTSSFGRPLLATVPKDLVIAPPGAMPLSDGDSVTPPARIQVDADSGAVVAGSGSATSATVLVPHRDLSELLAWQPDDEETALDQHQLLAALGALTARSTAGAGGAHLVALPRDTTIDAGLAGRIRALVEHPWIRGATLTQVASSTPSTLPRTATPGPTLSEGDLSNARSVAAHAGQLEKLVAAVDDPAAVHSFVQDDLMGALRTDLAPETRTGLTGRFGTRVTDLMHGIAVESSGTVNLINKEARFPVRVRSSLPWPVHVKVSLRPSDPRLSVTAPAQVTVPAHASVTAEVPVEAIGSGDLHVTYEVRTPGGHVLDASSKVFVRLRAGWEDAATAVAAVLVGIAFVWGVARSVRKRLRARAGGVSGDEGGTSDAASAQEVEDSGGSEESARAQDPGPPTESLPDSGAD
ncbi:hypothetical protein I6B53_00270 [Schaalia sp. 19OD2882]|uniref:DUF6049 family protein n=1 Tax=Schaalia sp. 19OD2882 TaxID=2794089 RepID=UPI001C1F05D8|nr:DUF6049 family protein [Schaalia sp. 19OD2882]QWW19620.1 hypothetical protein I6B53_00270 [Schaalia sp. 19OD2882]